MPEKTGNAKKNSRREVYLVEKFNLVGPFHDLNAAKRFLALMALLGGIGLEVEVVEIKKNSKPNAFHSLGRVG